MEQTDPGIRKTVLWLLRHGFHVADASDGETEVFTKDRLEPYILFTVTREVMLVELIRLRDLLFEAGVRLRPLSPEYDAKPNLQLCYDAGWGVDAVIDLTYLTDADLMWCARCEAGRHSNCEDCRDLRGVLPSPTRKEERV